jgi:hypothetical protein
VSCRAVAFEGEDDELQATGGDRFGDRVGARGAGPRRGGQHAGEAEGGADGGEIVGDKSCALEGTPAGTRLEVVIEPTAAGVVADRGVLLEPWFMSCIG